MRNPRLLFVVALMTGFISEKFFVSSQSPSLTTDDLNFEDQTSGDLYIDSEIASASDRLPIDDDDGEDYGSGSGSGDYDFIDREEVLKTFSNFSRTPVSEEIVPSQPQPTANSPHDPSTTEVDKQDPTTTKKEMETTPVLDGEVPDIGPTDDWFTQTTRLSSSSMPPIETTTTSVIVDITINTDEDEDNSIKTWDVSTPKQSGGGDQIKEHENEIPDHDRHSRMDGIESPKEVTTENLWERKEVLAAVIACGVVGFLCAVFLFLLLAYRMKKKDEGSYDLGDTKLSTTQYHKAPVKEFYA